MFSTREQNEILIKSDELEQGTIGAVNGINYPSNYRVRTKDFTEMEKGKYEITCEGAKQGNIVEYYENGTWKKTWFDVHTLFPWSIDIEENCKIRLSLSNGTEAEAIVIKPSDVKYIRIRKE